ncbi:MAG: alginate lyase family protein [Deferrisomatales bacterium]|nr:alginate lyase family protein [Deferrisomatales bacterium]
MTSPTLWVHTLRYLRPEQWVHRLRYALGGPPGLGGGAAPVGAELQPRVPFNSYPWLSAAEVAVGRFRFLNDGADYRAGVDWGAPGKGRLWRYNLHYFQYLFPEGGLEAPAGLQLIEDWVECNPPGTSDAWDPFPISLRLVNWIKFLGANGAAAPEEVSGSAFQQALWLEQRLERHLLANHFFKNLKALVFAGLFFEGPEAARWLATGERFLQRELPEQVLGDGGHFERSPMYHCMILEDCLDLLNVASDRVEPECLRLAELLRPACRRMAGFLAGMLHPDGEIALFNDAAFGIELPAPQLLEYAEAVLGETPAGLGENHWAFPQSGYYVLAPAADDRMLVDCGPVGPDYQPGHAHCDTLAYELALGGRRVVVDTGVYEYPPGAMRHYARSTAAHNTVRVDGEEQSEIWAAHRVGRRARPLGAELNCDGDGLRFVGSHDGYRRLGVTHEREITWGSESGWTVHDRLTGKGRHRAESFVHLHPEFRAQLAGNEVAVVDGATGETIAKIGVESPASVVVERGWYCPEFGMKIENDVLVVTAEGDLPLELGYTIRH